MQKFIPIPINISFMSICEVAYLTVFSSSVNLTSPANFWDTFGIKLHYCGRQLWFYFEGEMLNVLVDELSH